MAGFYSTVDEKKFKTPDMGEYYNEDLIEELLSSIEPGSPKEAAYYMEEPFSTTLGYHPTHEAFVLKADPIIKRYDSKYSTSSGAMNEDTNVIDADTIPFYLDSVNDGGMPFELNGEKYKSFKDYVYSKTDFNTFKKRIFKLRTIGINAPEVPHFLVKPIKKEDIIYATTSEMKRNNYLYIVNKERKEGTKYTFANVNGRISEVISCGAKNPYASAKDYDGAGVLTKDGVEYFKCLTEDKQTASDMKDGVNLGLEATKKALELLNRATDMRIVVDAKQLQTGPNYTGIYEILMQEWSEDNKLWDIVKAAFIKHFGKDVTKYAGFTTFGQDSYRRFLGAVYLKVSINGEPETWINMAKYVRAKVGEAVKLMVGTSPELMANGNGLSDAFKIWSYDNSKMLIADGFYNINKADFDDRRQLQKEITGLDFSTYRDYTVMIGDCLFMVPPTSIRIVNQIDSNRVPLLRSKGSMTKTKPHNERVIEMTLYFNGEHGINGVPVQKQLPRQQGTDEYETYYMNGLRSLIAMFKCTPFMPIENKYLNDVLGIEAVSLANIQINTMPMYPKCLAVTLTLQQFNYRIYLNEIPLPEPEEGENYNTNMYAKTINYAVMRYYYQRSIQAGEALKELSTDSQEYIESTMGSKTSLVPMEFKSQDVRFKILDENWLDKMNKIKKAAARQPLQQTQPLNQKTIDWSKRVGIAMHKIITGIDGVVADKKNGADPEAVKALRKRLIEDGKAPHLTDIDSWDGTFKFTFDTTSLTKEELSNLMIAITAELDIKRTSTSGVIFSNGRLEVKTKKVKNKNGVLVYQIDKNTDAYKIAEFFAFRSGALTPEDYVGDINDDNWDNFSTLSNEEFYKKLKDNAMDVESLYSAKFIDYPLNIISQQFTVSMGNTLSNTKLKIHEGYAPQYAGGQDTVIDFVFHTTDEATVTALNSLQEIAASQLIKYRQVVNCWPIRIESEITRLCGIHEVIIESVDISTVPMQPGLFAIQCRAISVDRTMRNREALQRIDSINNAGSTNSSSIGSLVYKTYFDINNTLSKAEVYPDLELPTIDELESTGYKFIRYMKDKDRRVYPDPDFYFVYGYAYSAQMLRKSIVEYFDSADKEKAEILGSEIQYLQEGTVQELISKVHEDKDEVVKYEAKDKELEAKEKEAAKKNEKLIAGAKSDSKETEKTRKKVLDSAQKLYEKSILHENELLAMQTYSWDICSKIKCTLPDDLPYISDKDTTVDESDPEQKLALKAKAAGKEMIKIIDGILSKPIDSGKHSNSDRICEGVTYQDDIRKAINKFINGEGGDTWHKLLSILGVKGIDSGNSKKIIKDIYESAAMALSGNTEYSKGADPDSYAPRAYYIDDGFILPKIEETDRWFPHSIIIDKETGGYFNANTRDIAVKQGITFGAYQVRKYDSEFLQEFYSNKKAVFNDMDFLDPYYNKALHKLNFNKEIDQTEYKTMIINSTSYAIAAFHRIVLVWVKKLIEDGNYLSIYDIARSSIKAELTELRKEYNKDAGKPGSNYSATYLNTNDKNHSGFKGGQYTTYSPQAQAERAKDEEINQNLVSMEKETEDIGKMVDKYEESIALGKVFLPVMCTVIHGDYFLYGRIKNKDIGALKSKTYDCKTPVSASTDMSDGERNYRKLVRGLSGAKNKTISGLDQIAGESITGLEQAIIDRSRKLWLSASEDPSAWILHSFYDMVVNNKRGRMARAFPTYYMMLIDEGREIGYWKLHDNFYNMSSISEIEVIKSRKMPADTANIVMTNMFKTFSTEDEDVRVNYEHNARDVFNSIFSPEVYFEEEEAKRMRQMNIHRAKIKPGVRIHLRMGYSGDAASLPILFNGVVTEATNGELIEITAQSDGHEIVNSQAFAGTTAADAADLENESSGFKWFSNFLTEGATPKELIRNIFTTKSGFFGKITNKFTNGRFFNDNMFGITHFGEIDYKTIHKDGEIMQNIYEAEGRMPWHKDPSPGSLAEESATKEAPHFTVELKDKSVWDVINVCASSSLEFIAGVAPFGVRSTIFMGRPHYYYAYDYTINSNGLILEKRKPFQQYHLIDSYSDIIGNNIKASGSDIKTVAVPTYKGPQQVVGMTVEKKLDPLWADWDIYPEFQKTMIVNTGMTWKANKLGALVVNGLVDKFSNNGGHKIAWRMGANALKNSFKDMYKGEVIIIGDTTIKPLDKIFIHDAYENMDGAVEVEAVVHRLDPETGFTSSVFADCISTVDSRYEEIGRMWTGQIASQIIAVKTIQYGLNKAFGTKTKPMLNLIARTVNKGAYNAASFINSAAAIGGKAEIIKYSSLENWSESFYNTVNLSSGEVAVWSKLDQFNGWKNALTGIDLNKIDTAGDLFKGLNSVLNMTDGTSPKELASVLDDALKKNAFKPNKVGEIQDLIKTLNNLKIDEAQLGSVVKSLNNSVISNIKAGANLTDEATEALVYLKKMNTVTNLDASDIRKMSKAFDSLKDVVELTPQMKQAATSIAKYGDDVAKIMTTADKAIKGARVASSLTTTVISAGVLSTALVVAAELAITYILCKSLSTWIENKMASFNVLTVYPLKKNETVLVAGIDGHKGLVIGSPSWNQTGPIDKFVNWVFKDRGPWYDLFKSVMFSEEMQMIAETYKKDNKLGSYADQKETTITELLSNIATDQASAYSTYKAMVNDKRISNIKDANAKYSYKKTRIKSDINEIPDHPDVQNELIPIDPSNPALDSYFESKTLRVAHLEVTEFKDGQDTGKKVDKKSISFTNKEAENAKVVTHAIKITDNIYDIPFLRPDAFHVFKRILDLIIEMTGNKGYGDNEKVVVWFKSGTRVNDTSWNATGYMFIFEVDVNKFGHDKIEKVFDTMAGEIRDAFVETNTDGESKEGFNIFQYQRMNNSNAYQVFVAPKDEYFKLQLD